MSTKIMCVRAAPAQNELARVVLCYRKVNENLLKRVKGKLDAKNLYLVGTVEGAVYQMEYCLKELTNFDSDLVKGLLSMNIIPVMERGLIQSLESIKRLESLVQPFKDEWSTIPQTVASQLNTIGLELHESSLELYLIREIIRLAAISRSKLPVNSQDGVRSQLVRKRVYILKVKRARNMEAKTTTKTQQSDTVFAENCSSGNSSPAGVMTPSEGWSDVGSQEPLLHSEKAEGSLTAEFNLSYCEGLVLGHLKSLNIVQPENKNKDSSRLVDSPGRILLRNACEVLAGEMAGSIDTITASDESVQKKSKAEPKPEKVDKTSDDIIEAMSPEITDRDIATLVFYWTTLDKFNGFTRVTELAKPAIFSDSPEDLSRVVGKESDERTSDILAGFLSLLILVAMGYGYWKSLDWLVYG